MDLLTAAASSPDAVTRSYEDSKCSYRDTRAECQAQGITFIPMIVDGAGGGWGDDAERVWATLARAIAKNNNNSSNNSKNNSNNSYNNNNDNNDRNFDAHMFE